MDPTTKAVAEAAGGIVKIAIEQGWFAKLLDMLTKKHRILVLGSTGAGKTNFLESLKALVPPTIDALNRTEFAQSRSFKVDSEPFIFIDTPGQIAHADRRRTAIREAMKQGIDGIINITSFGYHEHRSGRDEAFEANGSVSEKYLAAHRNLEIQLLGEWVELLGAKETANWLITVITKADLWWDRRKEVDEFYRTPDGPYMKALASAKALMPITLEYFSIFHRFYGRGGLSGMLDDSDRVKMRSHLLTSLLAGVSKKTG